MYVHQQITGWSDGLKSISTVRIMYWLVIEILGLVNDFQIGNDRAEYILIMFECKQMTIVHNRN